MKTSDLLVSLAWSRQGVAPVNGLSVGIRTRAWTRRGHPCFYLPAGSVLSSTLQLWVCEKSAVCLPQINTKGLG